MVLPTSLAISSSDASRKGVNYTDPWNGIGMGIIADLEVSQEETARHQQKWSTAETLQSMCTETLYESQGQPTKGKIWIRGWTKYPLLHL